MKMIPSLTAKSALKTAQISRPLSKNRLTVIASLSVALLTGLSGCSILEPYKAPLTQGTIITQENIGLIQEGLTKAQARQLFGPPLGEDPFNPSHWSYVYYSSDKTLHPDAVKRLNLQFDEDDMLKTWQISDEPIKIVR